VGLGGTLPAVALDPHFSPVPKALQGGDARHRTGNSSGSATRTPCMHCSPPAVVNRMVYVGGGDGDVYAYHLRSEDS